MKDLPANPHFIAGVFLMLGGLESLYADGIARGGYWIAGAGVGLIISVFPPKEPKQ